MSAMNQKTAIDGHVGANSFAHNLLLVRMNPHLQKQPVVRMSAALSVVCACVMRARLAIIEYLHSHLQSLVHWIRTPHRSYYRRKLVQLASKHNHRHTQQKPDWLKHETIHLKALMPQAGCRTIADICNRRFAASRQITVGKTYVHETLQRHAYEVQILRRNLKQAKPRNIPRNLIWGIDLTGKTDAHKSLHSIFAIIDHGSRALLHLQALHEKTSNTLLACVVEAIRTDNEPIFVSRTFREGLKRLGIRHQRTDPGCPWQNGRIERFFGTLKQKLNQRVYFPLPSGEGLRVREQLNRALDSFRNWYNHIRPHQNLDGRTPAEAWSGIDPYAKPARQEHWFKAWDGLLSGYHLRH